MEDKEINNNKKIGVMELTILENSHYSIGRKIRLVRPRVGMRGFFQLDGSCWYDTRVYGNHINKLIGFSLDLFNKNSVRLGWRPSEEEGTFEIMMYIHYGGRWIRSSDPNHDVVGIVDSSKAEFHIGFENETLMFKVNGEEKFVVMPFRRGWGWVMWFYFGGVVRSPQKMSARVNYVIE
jgi:hypothetical protein